MKKEYWNSEKEIMYKYKNHDYGRIGQGSL